MGCTRTTIQVRGRSCATALSRLLEARSGGRSGVVCVVLGRGADDATLDHWLAQAAPVEGFVGFAIGRLIWWDPLKAYVDGKIERAAGRARSRRTTCDSSVSTSAPPARPRSPPHLD
jgi:hypothetical protein